MYLHLGSCGPTNKVAGEDEIPPNKSRRLLAAKQARRLCAGHAHRRMYSSPHDSQTAAVHCPEVTHTLAVRPCAAVPRTTLVSQILSVSRLACFTGYGLDLGAGLLSASAGSELQLQLGLKPEPLQQQCLNRRNVSSYISSAGIEACTCIDRKCTCMHVHLCSLRVGFQAGSRLAPEPASAKITKSRAAPQVDSVQGAVAKEAQRQRVGRVTK